MIGLAACLLTKVTEKRGPVACVWAMLSGRRSALATDGQSPPYQAR